MGGSSSTGDKGQTPAKSPCPETGGKGGAWWCCKRGFGHLCIEHEEDPGVSNQKNTTLEGRKREKLEKTHNI